MFKRLHLQFTFYSTLITSLILIGMTFFCLIILEKQSEKGNYMSFQNNVNSILTHLENQDSLAHQWILQMESSYGITIRIKDNGSPLYFNKLNDDSSITPLLEQIQSIAKLSYALDLDNYQQVTTLTRHQEFSFRGADGQQYYASAALVPKNSGSLNISILYSLAPERRRIRNQRILFGIADTFAIILLGIFSFFFTKKMIKPIEESRKKQIQFIASASHELRTPLTVMLSSLSAMKIAPPEEAERFAKSIESEGHRMTHLINDMLSLANADNHNWRIHPEEIEPDTLLLQTYEKYEPLARSKQRHLSIELPDYIVPRMMGDGERLAQVLSILLDNAFSYTSANGHICLKLFDKKDRIEIHVADNGPGVPEELKESIFERFYRADKAHKDKEHFGLGLCIAQEIIRLHKGQIKIQDTPDGGATFVVDLPVL